MEGRELGNFQTLFATRLLSVLAGPPSLRTQRANITRSTNVFDLCCRTRYKYIDFVLEAGTEGSKLQTDWQVSERYKERIASEGEVIALPDRV